MTKPRTKTPRGNPVKAVRAIKPATKSVTKSTTPPAIRIVPIAAVGASAGGLDAFTELLTALPVDVGMALVLIQHLQPGHPSYLARILQKSTHLPVDDVVDGVRPEANHIYVMPAGEIVTLHAGRLRLRPRPPQDGGGAPRMPIDEFMRSLAAERHAAAIGVVLSGTASDGTQGLLAIKSEGGICLAQSEVTTEFSGMVQSAIASGAVDYVLAPAEIARELARLARYPRIRNPETSTQVPAVTNRDRAYKEILDLLRQHSGVDFTQYSSSTISRRIARRMGLHALDRPGDYLTYLRSHRPEVGQLFEDLLIPATRFFRDPGVFEALKRRLVTTLKQRVRGGGAPRGLRLWSVGCSSGEEAYSLAIIALGAGPSAAQPRAPLRHRLRWNRAALDTAGRKLHREAGAGGRLRPRFHADGTGVLAHELGDDPQS